MMNEQKIRYLLELVKVLDHPKDSIYKKAVIDALFKEMGIDHYLSKPLVLGVHDKNEN